MGKKQKLCKLRSKISCDIEKVITVLEHAIYKSDNLLNASILAEIALEKSQKISKNNEKMGMILKD